MGRRRKGRFINQISLVRKMLFITEASMSIVLKLSFNIDKMGCPLNPKTQYMRSKHYLFKDIYFVSRYQMQNIEIFDVTLNGKKGG